MGRHAVAAVAELPVGARKIVEVGGRSIGVFNVAGEFYALRNVCPHQGAPLCQGAITGTAAPCSPGEYSWEREGEIIVCPWHGWEFDIRTGRSLFNPFRTRVRSYPVSVEPADPRLETYPTSVEDGLIMLHI